MAEAGNSHLLLSQRLDVTYGFVVHFHCYSKIFTVQNIVMKNKNNKNMLMAASTMKLTKKRESWSLPVVCQSLLGSSFSLHNAIQIAA
jgi:hypothetical protein